MEEAKISRQTQIQILTDMLEGISKTEIFKKYSISNDKYAAIKESLLKQIKEKANDAETTTYAVRYFRNLARERKFTSKSKEFGLSISQTKLLNQIIIRKEPSDLRNHLLAPPFNFPHPLDLYGR